MKIAILSTPSVALPPEGYAGVERVVASLEQGLVQKGHDVTVYATGDSRTSAKLAYYYTEALKPSKKLTYNPYYFLNHVYNFFEFLKRQTFDIIHFNDAGHYSLYFLNQIKTPFVTTLHGSYRHTKEDPYNIVQEKTKQLLNFKQYPYISISNHQRESLPELNYVSTVYNGVYVQDYVFDPIGEGSYISWLGRVTKAKGLDIAIQTSKAYQKNIHIFGFIDPGEIAYFNEEIKPLGSEPQVVFHGETTSLPEKVQHLSKSKVFLFTPRWDEPFGIVLIEAMACGTPVVAFARGAVPEVIKDGETGFIVNPSEDHIKGNWIIKKAGVEGLYEALEKIYSMPENQYQAMRKACRTHVEQTFTAQKMTDAYEQAYLQVLLRAH